MRKPLIYTLVSFIFAIVLISCNSVDTDLCHYRGQVIKKFHQEDWSGLIELYSQLLANDSLLNTYKESSGKCESAREIGDGTYQSIGDVKEQYYRDRAYAFEKISDYNAAIGDYKNIIKLNPNNVVAWNNKALDEFEIGDFVNARSDMRTAMNVKSVHHLAASIGGSSGEQQFLFKCDHKIREQNNSSYVESYNHETSNSQDGRKCKWCGLGTYNQGFCNMCGAANSERVNESHSNAPKCEYCGGSGFIRTGGIYDRKKVCPSCRGTGKQTY